MGLFTEDKTYTNKDKELNLYEREQKLRIEERLQEEEGH